MLVSPGVDGNVVVCATSEQALELLGITDHVEADEEVGGGLVVLLQELKELGGCLKVGRKLVLHGQGARTVQQNEPRWDHRRSPCLVKIT